MVQPRNHHHRRRRFLGMFSFVIMSASLFTPLVAAAQTGPVIVTDQYNNSYDRLKTAKQEVVEKPFQIAFMQVLWNFGTFISQRLAYDAAVAIASAGSGQTPLVELRDPGTTYANDLLSDVAGAAIDALSGTLQAVNIHFNICAPQSPVFRMTLQLGIASAYKRPEPKCDFQDFVGNWESFIADSFSAENADENVLSRFAQAMNPRTTDLTVGITLYSQIFEDANYSKTIGLAEYFANDGYYPVIDAITGTTKTPADLIEKKFQEDIRAGQLTKDDINTRMSELFASKELWKQLGLSAFSVFTNTLLSQLTERLYSGLFDVDVASGDPFDASSISFSGGVEGAKAHFRSILAVNPISLDTYSAISDFTTCPGTTTRQRDNCVMDSNFASAVANADSGEPYTIQEAIDDGFLHGDWPLIASTDSRNVDTYCYTYGYCYANLVRLRLARVIPLGFEMAANLQSASSQDTLQTVVDAFDDPNSPYYHLVDPHWALKYPSTQCQAFVPGQLVSDDGSSRGAECVDAPSCIDDDASGNCVGGYGYCVQEKNAWDFRGEDCPEQYATCMSFTSSNGETEDTWLLNSVDFASCDSGSVGCLWYATVKDEDDDGVFDWPTIDDVPAADTDADAYQNRIYLTSSVESCDEADVGCQEFIEKTDDVDLNLIMNPSFEDDEESDNVPDHWNLTGTSRLENSGTVGMIGSNAVVVGGGGATGIVYQSDLPLQPGTFYTLSFYAAQPSSGTSRSVKVYLKMASEDGRVDVDLSGTSYSSDTCSLVDLDGNGTDETVEMDVTPGSDAYERFTCTFTSPTFDSRSLMPRVQFLDFVSSGVYLDAVQLEPDEDVSEFREGYGASISDLDLVYYTLPPAYLGCDGSETDPEACDDYAQICSAQDVGCDLYTPDNNDPSVPGIVSDADSCPASCNGYDTYKQESTRFEPESSYQYFIPDTAVSCTEAYVGCDEFTNLADESLEYFTDVRACLMTDQTSDEATFYTWEGSDLEGYQLKSWTLLRSDLNSAPCTSWTTERDTITCNDDAEVAGGALSTDDGSCDEHDDIFENPDCREFYDAAGQIHYRLYSDTVSVGDDCASYRKTDIAGATSDEKKTACDSAQGYWDGDTGECRFFASSEDSNSCPASQNGCREYTGNAGRNSSIVYTDDFEDDSVSEYTADGATASLSNESVATDGHSLLVRVTSDGGYASTVSGVLEGELTAGKVYILSFWAKAATGGVAVTPVFLEEEGEGDVDSFGSVDVSTSWQLYRVGPLDTTDLAAFDDTALLAFAGQNGDEFYIDNINLHQTEEAITVIKDSWNTPAACDQTPEGADSPHYYLGCQAYRDGDGETTYLKSFTRLCSESVVGCSAYFDTQASDTPYAAVYNLSCQTIDGSAVSTNTTCAVNGVAQCTISAGADACLFDVDGAVPRDGDQKVLQPDNTDLEVVIGPSTRVVDPDAIRYIVASSSETCTSDAVGCTEVGLPTFSQDQSQVAAWTSMYVVDDPDTYDTILCGAEDLFCDAWDTNENGTYYFKNPQEKTCEYRTGVSVGGQTYAGWFRSGTNDFCYGTGTCSEDETITCSTDATCSLAEAGTCVIETGTYLSSGTTSGLWHNGDSAYDGWVGSCEEQYDLCTEFIDPTDVGTNGVYGTDTGNGYYFIDNDLLDDSKLASAKQCNNQVSQKQGCALFDNVVDAEVLYNASASYLLSVHAGTFYSNASSYDLVDPVSCPDGGTVAALDGTTYDLCTSRCTYSSEQLHPYEDYSGVTGQNLFTFTGACLTDTDCPNLTSDGGDAVNGTCQATTFMSDTDDDGEDDTAIAVPALEDDANIVQKVNPDRACAEWFACSSSVTVWDPSTNSYTNVCDDIGLCTDYTAVGDATFCTNWNTDPNPILITKDLYAARDTGWFGTEYSGLTIPNEIYAHQLSQVNVSPANWCEDANGVMDGQDYGYTTPYVDCTDDEDVCATLATTGSCVSSETDYRLVYDAGTCDEANGEACTVGFCSASGSPCGSDLDCNTSIGETCDIGYCATTPTALSTNYQSCYTDNECDNATFNTCINNVCSHQTSTSCSADDECGSSGRLATRSCVLAAATQNGACYNAHCLLDPLDQDQDGEAEEFALANAEDTACRAWPDDVAPFNNGVVETWIDAADPATTGTSSIPNGASSKALTTKSTFEDVNLCTAGQDCDCSYDQMSYGSTVKYYDVGEGEDRLCVGGTYDQAVCDAYGKISINGTPRDSSDDLYCEDGGGTCTLRTSLQTLVGLEGYCLQRDTALNINGDQSSYACLAWLPVDRLVGASDIYGKATEAGYPLTDSYYCAEPRIYADVGTSVIDFSAIGGSVSDIAIACAETKDDNCNEDNRYNGWTNVACPKGYFGVVGSCDVDADTSNLANYCVEDSSTTGAGDDDQPFFCVPIGSVHVEDDLAGEDCLSPDEVNDFASLTIVERDTRDLTFGAAEAIYQVKGSSDPYADFDAVAKYYSDCYVRGIEYTEGLYNDVIESVDPFVDRDFDTGYRGLTLTVKDYAACRALVQTSSEEGNKAWTNRLLFDKRAYAIDESSTSDFSYVSTTLQKLFGASQSADRSSLTDAYPTAIAQCIYQDEDYHDGSYIQVLNVPDGGDFETCLDAATTPAWFGSNSNPEARSFVPLQLSDLPTRGDGFGYPWNTSFGSETIADGLSRINQIFAGILGAVSWDDGKPFLAEEDRGGYGDVSDSWTDATDIEQNISTYDVTGTGDDNVLDGAPSAPVIRSVGSTCVNQNCQEGSDGRFSLNGEDREDVLGDGGQLLANVKFFVEANPNQMPIRRVMIDWQDGEGMSGSLSPDNYYKNHRGLDAQNDPFCQDASAADNWGETTDACDPSYFEAQHIYTCSAGMVDALTIAGDTCSLDAYGNLETSPCVDTDGLFGQGATSCVFQPRVHIRDNWGWCTGVCGSDSSAAGTSCYDSDGDISESSGSRDECDMQTYPNADYPTINPWSYYDGVVIVEP